MIDAYKKHVGSVRLLAEQVELLYGNASLAYIVTLANGAILCYVLRAFFPVSTLLGWYGTLLLITVVRALIAWCYQRVRPGADEAKYWNVVYAVGAGAAGSVWGAAALMLLPAESIGHQVFVAFVLAGMAAGGISVLATRMEACLAFLVLSLMPLAIRFLSHDAPLQSAMGLMTLIFLGGISLAAYNLHRRIRMSLDLSLDKQRMAAEIVRRQFAEEQLFQEKERLQITIRSIGEGVASVDADGHIDYLNAAAETLSGRNYMRALRQMPGDVFECYDYHERRIATALEDCLDAATPVKKQSILIGADRRKYLIEEIATPLFDRHGKTIGAVSVFRDVTDAVQMNQQLAYAADHDVLTGLPNRNLLNDRLQHAIARAQRKYESFALLFLDLDEFKAVNDSMGHASGDALLIDAAKRLTRCVREEDTVARLGGDEFVVLLDGPVHRSHVQAIADKMLVALHEPFQLNMGSAFVTASIGFSMFPADGRDVETLLAKADAAMYRAKRMGRNQFHG